jgi:uncharacterized metal-binding protein
MISHHGVCYAAISHIVNGSETNGSSAVAVSGADAFGRIAADAALRHELERIAAMSILPSIRKGSPVSADAVRKGRSQQLRHGNG